MKSENKVDLGSIQIHKKVIEDIARTAVEGIDSVSLVSGDLTTSVLDLFGRGGTPGISVNVDKNNQVVIEAKVNVRYGMNIPEIARHTQDAVRSAIEKTVDINLKEVNVNIQGIERGE